MLNIIPIKAFKDNYIWLLINPETKDCVCVDPGSAPEVIEVLKRDALTLTTILITHHHWDHAGGVPDLLKQYDVPVYGPANEAVSGMTTALGQDDKVNLSEIALEFTVHDIPGHTSGHIAYHGGGLLFCGDTLFLAGCGRVFEGTYEQMYDSLSKLAALPDETQVYCAHEYTETNLRFALEVEPRNKAIATRLAKVQALRSEDLPSIPATLADEKQTNPFLRCGETSIIEAVSRHTGNALATPVEVFAALREWKDHWA